MKAELKFSFELPEEQADMDTVMQAAAMRRGVRSFDEFLRSKCKYGVDMTEDWPTDKNFEDAEEPILPFNLLVVEHVYNRVRDALWKEVKAEDVSGLYD